MTIFEPENRPLPLALVAAVAVSTAGSLLPSTALPWIASSMAQAQVIAPQDMAGSLPVEICLDLPDWQRPSQQTQQKHLQTMPQYGPALQSEPLLSVAKNWWSHEIFSFTTYGLSARTDPLYLSGLWTVVDHTWACYEGTQPEQINQGNRAEVWLMNHRFLAVQWQQDHYVMIVEPAESGLQLVQFPRQDQSPSLPLSLMTASGEPLAVMSGDW
ncbi:MAG: hypothetical protein VKI82_12480 [Leptolyngbya sp.]|nr:hypothetical protein [Leptolyngbya sp.]